LERAGVGGRAAASADVVADALARLANEDPELVYDALIAGLSSAAPYSLGYLKLAVEVAKRGDPTRHEHRHLHLLASAERLAASATPDELALMEAMALRMASTDSTKVIDVPPSASVVPSPASASDPDEF
jgi:hypothetical protein